VGLPSNPVVASIASPSGGGSVASQHTASNHVSPSNAGSQAARESVCRQDAADARTLQLERAVNTVSANVQSNSEDGKQLMGDMIGQLGAASGAAAAQASATALAAVEQAAQVAAGVAAAQTLAATQAHAELTTLMTTNNTAATGERAEMMASIDELRARAEIQERDASSAWDDLSNQIREIQEARPLVPDSVSPVPEGTPALPLPFHTTSLGRQYLG